MVILMVALAGAVLGLACAFAWLQYRLDEMELAHLQDRIDWCKELSTYMKAVNRSLEEQASPRIIALDNWMDEVFTDDAPRKES